MYDILVLQPSVITIRKGHGMSLSVNGSGQTNADINLRQFFDDVLTNDGAIAQPSGSDTAHYLTMLDRVDMSDSDKTGLIHSLWHVLDGIVRLQFGIHPLTDIMNEKAAMRASHSVAVVQSSPIKTSDKNQGETQ